MKKVKFLIIIIIMVFIFNMDVFAATGSLSVSSDTVKAGDTFTITVDLNSVSTWDIQVSTTGPVTDCSIVQSGSTDDNTDVDKSFSATCTAEEEGTITVELSGSVTSSIDDIPIEVSDSVSITVEDTTEKKTKEDTSNKEEKEVYTQSDDNVAKEIRVEGYELTKVDYKSYVLTVPNGVTSINIIASAEHPRAKVSGTGKHNLDVGENIIEVIIVSESRLKNRYTIKVIRKEGYSLEELDTVLNDDNLDNININIESDTIIKADDLKKIKKSKKTVYLNYYENNIIKYSWVINGKKLKFTGDFNTEVSLDKEDKKDILRLTDSEDGIFIYSGQLQDLPGGLKLKIYIENIFKNKETVNIYSYDRKEDKLSLVKKNITVKDKYIEFNVTDVSNYLITKTIIPGLDEKKDYKLVAIILTIAITVIAIVVLGIAKSRKNKPKKKTIKQSSINQTINNPSIDYKWYENYKD